MPRQARALTDMAVRNLKVPGLHFVGEVPGLALQVLPERKEADGRTVQARTWVLRVMIGGKRRDMGLGGYPGVTLTGAREKARQARQKIADGLDPIEERKAAQSALRAQPAKVMTFKEAARAYIAAHEASWKNAKHRQQWTNSLEAYAYPVIGHIGVADVDLPHVLKIIEGLWTEKTETATRLRGRIELVLDWAAARGLRQGLNPARWRGHLDKILPRPSKVARVKHHAALPVGDVGAFMTQLRQAGGLGARALELAILTATRSGEIRGATWAEIDLKAKVWTIPKERMKAGREHRIPLSPAAIVVLEEVPRMAGTDLVFPAAGGGQLSDMTLLAVIKRMKVPAVPHGFRSTFRDWAAERTAYPQEVCEAALAHTISNKTEAAYRRGDLFEKRRRLMNEWATFLSRPETVSPVSLISDRVR